MTFDLDSHELGTLGQEEGQDVGRDIPDALSGARGLGSDDLLEHSLGFLDEGLGTGDRDGNRGLLLLIVTWKRRNSQLRDEVGCTWMACGNRGKPRFNRKPWEIQPSIWNRENAVRRRFIPV